MARTRFHVSGPAAGEPLPTAPVPFPSPAETPCRRCGEQIPLHAGSLLGRRLYTCAGCGGAYFYREKDFPRLAGLLILLAAAGLFLYFSDHWWAIGFLLGAAALDWVAYVLVPFRTICYRCLAEYRGFEDNPDHGTFELGVASRFADPDPGKGV